MIGADRYTRSDSRKDYRGDLTMGCKKKIAVLIMLVIVTTGTIQLNSGLLPSRHEKMMGLTSKLDLSDRNGDLQIREFLDRTNLVDGCLDNFGRGPCKHKVAVFLQSGSTRLSEGIAEDFSFLANQLVNPLHGRKPKALETTKCKQQAFSKYVSWAQENHGETKKSTGILVPFPEEHWYCYRPSELLPSKYNIFWIWVEGNAVGSVVCGKLSIGPNPQCTSTLFVDHGRVKFVIGSVPAASLSKLVNQLSQIFSDFISRYPKETKEVNEKAYFGSPIVVSRNAQKLVKKIEKEVR